MSYREGNVNMVPRGPGYGNKFDAIHWDNQDDFRPDEQPDIPKGGTREKTRKPSNKKTTS